MLARARELSAARPGPETELIEALAGELAGMHTRMAAIWRVITAVVEAAETAMPGESVPPPEFVAAMQAARGAEHQAVRLTIAGQEWVAAIQPEPGTDPVGAWADVTRAANSTGEEEPPPDAG